jgi:hypothetical protein
MLENVIYYVNIDGEMVRASSEFNSNNLYYILQSSTEKLDASLKAVPPNNNFILTPLYN